MRRKKSIAIILMLILAFTLVACGVGGGSSGRDGALTSPETTPPPAEMSEPTPMNDSSSQDDISNTPVRVVINEDGAFIECYGIIRFNHTNETDKFGVIGEDGHLITVVGEPFTEKLHSSVLGDFDYIFYSFEADGKIYAVPYEDSSEWMAFHFLVHESTNSFYACTDTGIYRIDPMLETAILVSGNEYNGTLYNDMFILFQESGGYPLTWIANPILSADGLLITFQSNRKDVAALPSQGDSLWLFSANTNEEYLLIDRKGFTCVPLGFVADDLLLMRFAGSESNTDDGLYVVNTLSGALNPLTIGDLSNVNVDDTHFTGLIALSTYNESDIREVIINVDVNGECSVIAEIQGSLHYARFSPCGSKVAAVLRVINPDLVDAIITIDTSSGQLTQIHTLDTGSYVSSLTWINNRRFLVSENTATDGRVYAETVLYELS